MQTLPNQPACGKGATRKRNRKVGIILGCQRMTGTWRDVIAMARNGYAVIRELKALPNARKARQGGAFAQLWKAA